MAHLSMPKSEPMGGEHNSLEDDIERSGTPRRVLSPRPRLVCGQKEPDICEYCHGFGKPTRAFSGGEINR